jgi:predicted nuclease of predicted toxin-antitoxin system
MLFLLDEQLPIFLCAWIRSQGHSALHVDELRLSASEDHDVWSAARRLADALITKDQDFISIRTRATEGPAVVWLRVGNATNPALLSWIESRFPAVVAAIEAGETIIEVK